MNIGLLGIGTIGSGVFEQINDSYGKFSESIKIPARITKVLDKDLDKNVGDALISDNPSDILDDDSIEIVVALMGGGDFEYEQIKKALEKGKHVITANKAIIGSHMKELTDLAEKNNVMLRYEASVGGGIPIIKALEEQIRNNDIDEIKGILNGTTNYILTKMVTDKADFENTLKEAQAIGFAEANPEADLNGDDAARKLAILSSLAYGQIINDNQIPKRGIVNITNTDINEINRLGYNVKHIAQSKKNDDNISLIVEPVLVRKNSLFSSVNNEFNLISLNGDKTGPLMFYGKGAGKDATANAIVQDVIDVIDAINKDEIINQPVFENDFTFNNSDTINGQYYFRIMDKNSKHYELSDIMEMIEDFAEIDHIHTSDGNIFVLTKPCNQNQFEEMINKLEIPEDEYFYARILD